MPDEWIKDAACKGMPTEWWFADYDEHEKRWALRVCAACPVKEPCLAAALVEEKGYSRWGRAGIRGGLVPHQRNELDKAMRRAAG